MLVFLTSYHVVLLSPIFPEISFSTVTFIETLSVLDKESSSGYYNDENIGRFMEDPLVILIEYTYSSL
jgi:hypothetical protein